MQQTSLNRARNLTGFELYFTYNFVSASSYDSSCEELASYPGSPAFIQLERKEEGHKKQKDA